MWALELLRLHLFAFILFTVVILLCSLAWNGMTMLMVKAILLLGFV